MANVAACAALQDGETPDKATITFMDLEVGTVQTHAVNQAPMIADYLGRGGTLSERQGMLFFGYVPSLGLVYFGPLGAGGTSNTTYEVYIVGMGDNELATPAGIFSRIEFSFNSGIGLGADLYSGAGVDADAMYVANANYMWRLGFDGSISRVAFTDSYKTARGSTCPILWRGPTGFRAFVQLGTSFDVDKRGASEQFNFVSGATVLVTGDSARMASGVELSRGPEFSGFFYGYQPLNNDPTNSYVQYLDGGLPALSWTGASASGGDLTSIGFSSSSVHQEVSTMVASGSSYFRSNVVIGQTITSEVASFGGGYVGDMPPYKSSAAFWTDIVYCTEIV